MNDDLLLLNSSPYARPHSAGAVLMARFGKTCVLRAPDAWLIQGRARHQHPVGDLHQGGGGGCPMAALGMNPVLLVGTFHCICPSSSRAVCFILSRPEKH